MKYTTRKSLLTNIYCTPDRCCLRRYGNVPYSLLSHILWHHEIYAISVNIFTCTQYKFQFIYRLLSKLLISFWKHFLNSQNLFCFEAVPDYVEILRRFSFLLSPSSFLLMYSEIYRENFKLWNQNKINNNIFIVDTQTHNWHYLLMLCWNVTFISFC